MQATDDTMHHKLIAQTYSDLAKVCRKENNWEKARYYAGKARKEWLKVQWRKSK